MILPDVNVLVAAFREDAVQHRVARTWLEDIVNGTTAIVVPGVVLSGFVRIVTHPRIFSPPADVETTLGFVDDLRSAARFLPGDPGPRHWRLFADLCRDGRATGNLVPDAYIAASAVEHDATVVTFDRGFARFPGVRWEEPTASA